MFSAKLFFIYIYIYIYIYIKKTFKIWKGHGPHPCIQLHFQCHKQHRTISLAPFSNRWVGCQSIRVGCQFHVYLPFGKICGKVVYIFCGFIFQVKIKGKKKTMNINSKRKKNPGKEIKHLLFFIVGKVAILSRGPITSKFALFLGPQTIIELLLQLSSVTDGLVVGCYGLVVSFTYT